MDPQGNPNAKLESAAEVSEAFRKRGYRPIQYGGATVEAYSNGSYCTGDIGIGFIGKAPSLAEKNEVMQSLGCKPGLRLFNLAALPINILPQFEALYKAAGGN
jgi:hypothetical protein